MYTIGIDLGGTNIAAGLVNENYQIVRKKLHRNTKLCCVVKANAYGHGAKRVCRNAFS